MKRFARNLASFARTIALATIVASPTPSACALAPGAPGATGGGAAGQHAHGYSPGAPSGTAHFPGRIDFPTAFSMAGLDATVPTGSTIPGADGVQAQALIPGSFLLGLPGAGAHFDMGGFGAGTSGLAGPADRSPAVSASAPIPETEIWAMMFVGIGLVVIRLRQKSRLAGSRHFT
jgi:hypothetical protein